MSRLVQFLSFSLATLCLARDSGFYVNRIKIQTFHNDLGNDKAFTYYVANSFDQSQVDNFKTESGSIGSLFEDDYRDDSVTCASECRMLRKIYAHTSTANGKISTRIIDSALKANISGSSSAKPIGLVAPYPGYCSSDDTVPIFEMYSEYLKQYAYWSPLQPNQLVNIDSATIDKSRYVPTRLVGYALAHEPSRLALENSSPDFQKSIGKSNYTHSAFPTNQLIQFSDGDHIITVATASAIDVQPSLHPTFKSKSLGVFLLQKITAAELRKLDLVCGPRLVIYTGANADRTNALLFVNSMTKGYTSTSQAGFTFSRNKPECGGIKGLGQLKEFKHNTKVDYFTYANEKTKIDELLKSGEWTETNKFLGYAPLDQTGLLLINAVV